MLTSKCAAYRYDVFVIQAYGYKNWTVCHPINTFNDFPNANQAQRAQLHQIAIAKNSKLAQNPWNIHILIMTTVHPESAAVASCDNFDPADLLRTTNCQNFTLFTGDVLYLTKATIHYATTDPNQISAHLTVSIDREDRTWQDLVTAAALVTENPAADLVVDALKTAANTYPGMPWYMLPSPDHEQACQQLSELVLGFEPWSLRSLLRSTPTPAWVSSLETSRFLQQLGRCNNDLGNDINGIMLTGTSLVHHTSLEIKQRKRRAVVTVNCGNTCICRTCNGNACDTCVSCFGHPFTRLILMLVW
jgi:hypothetical protein